MKNAHSEGLMRASISPLGRGSPPEREGGLVWLFETCGVSRLRMMITISRDSSPFISMCINLGKYIVHKCVDIFWLHQGQCIAIPTLYLFIAPVLFRYQSFHWKISSCLSPPIELAFSNNSMLPLCQPLSTAHHNYCASVSLLTRVIVLLSFFTSLKYIVTVWMRLTMCRCVCVLFK